MRRSIHGNRVAAAVSTVTECLRLTLFALYGVVTNQRNCSDAEPVTNSLNNVNRDRIGEDEDRCAENERGDWGRREALLHDSVARLHASRADLVSRLREEVDVDCISNARALLMFFE